MPADQWFRNAVIYSLNVETFMDADGDGCGDFDGLSRRLDYLESLGVDALWLAPFQPTPGRDNGYDIRDYYNVDPRFGSSGDFVEFMHEADSRGIRVIIDLVVNHTSDQHPWFKQARGGREAAYHDWYVWAGRRPRDWQSGMVFPGVQRTTWTFERRVREYYFHRFYDFEPDLNMANPRVREEVRRIMGYWLQLGIAGFRVDAVPFVIEIPSADGSSAGLDFEWLREMREFLQWRVGNAVLLGEANVPPKESGSYFAGGDGLHMMFNFWVNQHLFWSLASGDARPLAGALEQTRPGSPDMHWAQFLRNHDELDIGHLPDDARQGVFEAFGPEPSMQLYGRGIRRRLAPMLGDRRVIELAKSLLLSLPGTPVLRYGDEIGMGDNLRLKERMAIRTPMQWTDERHAGFTSGERPIVPPVGRGLYAYETVNVENQRRDPDSLLRWMIRMIRLRKECPEIGWGDWKVVRTNRHEVLAILYWWRNTRLLCVHNLAQAPCEVRLKIDAERGNRLANLIDQDEAVADARGVHHLELEPYGYRWYRVGGLGYALDRGPAR
jgi:maltose alpha-D-glucosyltransferase / alpha-amylase